MARQTQQSRILHSGPGSPATYTEIEQVVTISGPDGQASNIDCTHLRSTAKEYLAGLADFGQITLTCNYTGGTKQIDMFNMYTSHSDPEPFALELPTSAAATTFDIFAFNASVTQWALSVGVDDKQVLNMTLKITGSVTRTAGAATL